MKHALPTLSGQSVLITGGLGFVGSNLAHECVRLGARVTLYDNHEPRSGANRANLRGLEGAVDLIEADIRDTGSLGPAVERKDIIFHCAAHTSHPGAMKEPVFNAEVNGGGTLNLLEAVRFRNPSSKVVYVGTSTQIGRMHYVPIDEQHPEFPVDLYSCNKATGEKYTLIYGKSYGLRTTALRLANTYGPRAHIRTPEFGFMNYFVGIGLSGKELTVYGDGRQLRNVNFIEDSVAALILASQSDAADGQVYFAVSDEQFSVLEIAQAITECVGGSIRSVEWPKERAAIEVGDAVISNEKIRAQLSWKPLTGLREGLKRTADYYRPVLGAYL